MFDTRHDVLENLGFVLDYDDFKSEIDLVITEQDLQKVKDEVQKEFQEADDE